MPPRSTSAVPSWRAATGLSGWSLAGLPAALWVERHEPEVAAPDVLVPRDVGLPRAPHDRARGDEPARRSAVPVGRRPRSRRGCRARRCRHRSGPARSLGELTADAAAQLGIEAGIPVVAGIVDAWASFHGAGMTQKGDAIDVGGAAGGFGVYWDQPLSVPGLVHDDRAAARPVQRRRGDGGDRPGDRLVPDRDRRRRRLDRGAPRGGGRDAARRRRRPLPAVPRRRALADLGPDRARRLRRADARPPARPPDAGDPRGVGVRDPPCRRADPRRRRGGRGDAGLRRAGPERDVEPGQGRRHRLPGRGAGGARDGRGRRGDPRGGRDRRVPGRPGGDPGDDPRRPPARAARRAPRPVRRRVRRLRPAPPGDRARCWRGFARDRRRPAGSRRAGSASGSRVAAEPTAGGARRVRPRGRARRDRRADRAERLRQEHVPAGRRRAARSRRGRDDARRPADRRSGPDGSGWCSRSRDCCRGDRSPTTSRTRSSWPGGPRERRARAPGRAAGARRPRRRRDRPAEPALGRDAPAGRDRPGARARARGAAPRRAVQRARRADPRPVQPRAARALGADRLDDRDRHPQHPGGDPPRRPGRRHDPAAGPRRRRRSGSTPRGRARWTCSTERSCRMPPPRSGRSSTAPGRPHDQERRSCSVAASFARVRARLEGARRDRRLPAVHPAAARGGRRPVRPGLGATA